MDALSFGLLFFLVLSAQTGRFRDRIEPPRLFHSACLGVLLLVGGTGLVNLAETRVDSYLVALIIPTTPLCVSLFDWLLAKKRISLTSLDGVL